MYVKAHWVTRTIFSVSGLDSIVSVMLDDEESLLEFCNYPDEQVSLVFLLLSNVSSLIQTY